MVDTSTAISLVLGEINNWDKLLSEVPKSPPKNLKESGGGCNFSQFWQKLAQVILCGHFWGQSHKFFKVK